MAMNDQYAWTAMHIGSNFSNFIYMGTNLGIIWVLILAILNIIIYMGTNFSNFVLENYSLTPLKISLSL